MNIINTFIYLIEDGGVHNLHLELAFKYLMSIHLISIKRAYKTAAHIRNKLRGRLGDDTLDALLFLR